MEAVTNIRTVASFGNDNIILDIFDKKLVEPIKLTKKKGTDAGIALGIS